MREIFSLVGRIYTEGLDTLQKGLNNADKQLTKVGKSFDKFGRNVTKLGVSITKLTVPITAMGVAAFKGVEAASDLAETVSKVGQIFGDSASEIEAWAGTTASTLGQSKQQALDAASTFAIFGKSAGLTGQSLVNFSENFTTLASDLASFNNTTPEDAITAIGAALRGESEPIRRYGVLLNDASLKQKALEMGIITSTKNALTPQAKVLASSALIMEQTKTVQGDFARTSEGLANTQRILKAEVADLTAEFGKAFLPVALQVAGIIKDKILPTIQKAVDWWNGLSDGVKNAVIYFGAAAVALGPILIGIGQAISMVKTFTTVFKMLNLVMIQNPIGLIITLIGGLVAAGILLYKNWDFVKAKMEEAWGAISYATQVAVANMKIWMLSAVQAWLDGVDQIVGAIPGINKVVDNANKSVSTMIAKEMEHLATIKMVRMEAKLQADQNSALTKTIEAAKQATTEYKDVSLENIDVQKEDVKVKKEQKQTALDAYMARVAYENEWSDKLRTEVSNRSEMLEWEYQQAIVKAEELGADRQDVETYYQIQRLRLAAEEAKKKDDFAKAGNQMQKVYNSEGVQMGLQAIDQIFSLAEQSTDNKLALIDQETAKNKAAIESSVMSEAAKKDKIAALEANADKKKRELLRKQAQRDKAAAIFGAVVNTFQAVSKALTLGFPLGLIMAGIFGALGAIQIGMIAAQPLPQLAEGGLVKQTPGGVQAIVGEGNQDELILPMRTGVRDIVRGVIDGIVGAVLPPATSPALALGGGGSAAPASAVGGGVHYHIGTLIADESGLKMLERKMRPIRTAEDQRRGIS